MVRSNILSEGADVFYIQGRSALTRFCGCNNCIDDRSLLETCMFRDGHRHSRWMTGEAERTKMLVKTSKLLGRRGYLHIALLHPAKGVTNLEIFRSIKDAIAQCLGANCYFGWPVLDMHAAFSLPDMYI